MRTVDDARTVAASRGDTRTWHSRRKPHAAAGSPTVSDTFSPRHALAHARTHAPDAFVQRDLRHDPEQIALPAQHGALDLRHAVGLVLDDDEIARRAQLAADLFGEIL